MLRNIVVLHDAVAVTPDMLPGVLTEPPGEATAPAEAGNDQEAATPARSSPVEVKDMGQLAKLIRPIAEVEWETIENAVALCGGDVRKAAVFLGIGPATIYRKRNSRKVATQDGVAGR